MDRLIYHNDRIIDVADASLAPTIAGLLYGWGVFTTILIADVRAFAFDRHWERLTRHSEKARVPVVMDFGKAQGAINELILANSVKEGRARLTLLKGEAGSWRGVSDLESEMLILTSTETLRLQSEAAITISPCRILSSSQLAGVKQTAMLENLFALDEARSRGFTEAVMLNERGEIVSATAANIFWVQGDEVFTPSPATGCIAGVTRRFVMDISARLGLHLVEGSFSLQRLTDAREVFLTSTARGIAIVSSFDLKEYSRREARIAKLISREYQKLVRDEKVSQ